VVLTEETAKQLIIDVRAEIEQRISAPGENVSAMEAELKQLERQKAKLAKAVGWRTMP
jgi:hypothetical protein